MLAPEILRTLEADLDAKWEELRGAELLFSDGAEKLHRLCVAGLHEEAAAYAGNVRILAHELVVATEAWIASMRRAKSAVGA
jgi:hypothetical protein